MFKDVLLIRQLLSFMSMSTFPFMYYKTLPTFHHPTKVCKVPKN